MLSYFSEKITIIKERLNRFSIFFAFYKKALQFLVNWCFWYKRITRCLRASDTIIGSICSWDRLYFLWSLNNINISLEWIIDNFLYFKVHYWVFSIQRKILLYLFEAPEYSSSSTFLNFYYTEIHFKDLTQFSILRIIVLPIIISTFPNYRLTSFLFFRIIVWSHFYFPNYCLTLFLFVELPFGLIFTFPNYHRHNFYFSESPFLIIFIRSNSQIT